MVGRHDPARLMNAGIRGAVLQSDQGFGDTAFPESHGRQLCAIGLRVPAGYNAITRRRFVRRLLKFTADGGYIAPPRRSCGNAQNHDVTCSQ